MTETSGTSQVRTLTRPAIGLRSNIYSLRSFAVVLGGLWSVAFVVVGLHYGLQMYGDGSMFSYAVAVQDAWAFHWHNISGRVIVYLYASVPSEAYVGWSGNAHGGVVLYGLLFFAAPLLGLVLTYKADHSDGRVIFGFACASTAALCPLVFGFPTEVWLSHALFWPALAISHYARGSVIGVLLVFLALLALVLTHGGALVFAVAILASLALRGLRDPVFLRTVIILFLVMAAWSVVHLTFPADPYFVIILRNAALHVFDVSILSGPLVMLLLDALASYVAAFLILHRLGVATIAPEKIHLYAGTIVALGLAVYWAWFDHALHTENRYFLRTALIVVTPIFGILASATILFAENRLRPQIPLLPWLTAFIGRATVIRVAAGALAVVTLIHVVETTKFVSAWSRYTDAIRSLATGTISDPGLGDPILVSSERISPELNRLSWFSTTPYLSVLVAPDYSPRRLVVDPSSDFFWLSCRTATANFMAVRAVPAETRRLIQKEACLHK